MLIFVKYYELSFSILAWYNRGMNSKDLAAEFVIKHDEREDFLHSSGYAKVQNKESFGAAGAASFEARKALDEQRKFIHSYKSSQIGARRYAGLKPEVYKPEVSKPEKTPEADVAPERPLCYNKRHGGISSDG